MTSCQIQVSAPRLMHTVSDCDATLLLSIVKKMILVIMLRMVMVKMTLTAKMTLTRMMMTKAGAAWSPTVTED